MDWSKFDKSSGPENYSSGFFVGATSSRREVAVHIPTQPFPTFLTDSTDNLLSRVVGRERQRIRSVYKASGVPKRKVRNAVSLKVHSQSLNSTVFTLETTSPNWDSLEKPASPASGGGGLIAEMLQFATFSCSVTRLYARFFPSNHPWGSIHVHVRRRSSGR